MMRILSFLVFLLLFCSHSIAQVAPDNMSLLANWQVDTLPVNRGITYNDVWGYVDCDGREYAIMGTTSAIHFFDIEDPTAPREISAIRGGDTTAWRDMKTFRNYAYSVADAAREGLLIFDLTHIRDSVTLANRVDSTFVRAHNIFIEEATGRLYVVGTEGSAGDLLIYDLNEDPANPKLLSSLTLPGGRYIHDIYVRDNIAYASHGWNGLYVWDLNDPTNAINKGSVVTGGYNHSSWLTEDGQYSIYAEEVPFGLPLGVVDLNLPDTGELEVVEKFMEPILGRDSMGLRPHNPYVRGDYLIVSYYYDGVVIFDISDPLNPKRVAFFDTTDNENYPNRFKGVWGVYPYLPSGTLVASDVETGLYLLRADSIEFAPVEPVTLPEISIEWSPAGDSSFCDGDRILLSASPSDADSFIWTNTLGLTLTEPTYDLIKTELISLTVAKQHCTKTMTQSFTFNEPIQPTIIQISNDTLIATSGGSNYQWFLDDNEIDGATDSVLIIASGGAYRVEYTDVNGCQSGSDPASVLFTSVGELDPSIAIELSPNPAQRELMIAYSIKENSRLEIIDMLGQVLQQRLLQSGELRTTVDVGELPAGMYLVRIVRGNRFAFKSWIKN